MSIFSTCKSLNEANILESAANTYDSIETLEEGVLKYTPSMVPVHARNTAEGTKYLVEFDMLQKLQKSIVEAFEDVCEENNISEDDTYVAVPNNESAIEDVYVSESSYLKQEISSTTDDINSLMEAGVNVLSYEPLNEFGINKDLKAAWKNRGEGMTQADRERSLTDGKWVDKGSRVLVKDLFGKANSIADFKFVKSKTKAIIGDINYFKLDTSFYDDIISKCDEKITELKEAKKASKK